MKEVEVLSSFIISGHNLTKILFAYDNVFMTNSGRNLQDLRKFCKWNREVWFESRQYLRLPGGKNQSKVSPSHWKYQDLNIRNCFKIWRKMRHCNANAHCNIEKRLTNLRKYLGLRIFLCETENKSSKMSMNFGQQIKWKLENIIG